MSAISAVTTTTRPIPVKRLRGRSRQGERERERDLVPRRLRPEREAAPECARREEEGEAEDHEQQLRDEVDERHDESERVQLRLAQQPDQPDRSDHDAADDHVSRMLGDRVHPDREPEGVREEERRERDHDQVVEEERPAGDESREVVEGDPHERRGASGLADRRRPFCVRQCHDEEKQARDGENRGRQPERVQRDDPEREIERRRDLAVGDRSEGRRVERPLQLRQLAGHRPVSLSPSQEIQAAEPQPDEEHT
jgi:hypothetical protein